jgi:dTDP-4-dehydro-6-deoxy-alpha-D-glucopyranose 2,3-dehydratase
MTEPRVIFDWLDHRRRASALRVRRIPLARCRAWRMERGELVHDTRRYFQVTGALVRSGTYAGWHQPMIRQEEVGILGFVVRERARGAEWLLQSKTEPGNVAGTQIAPSVQATLSNHERVHGGEATRYLEWFGGSPPNGAVISDALHSEQGTRFVGKHNRNVITLAEHAPPARDGSAWRWAEAASLRHLLRQDFTVNTDARSVVASAPWRLLAEGGRPFASSRRTSGFVVRLAASYEANPDVAGVLRDLQERRARTRRLLTEVPLDETPGWDVAGTDGSRIAFVDVSVDDREVRNWCQPLLAAGGAMDQVLYCQQRDGVLRFLFHYVAEPGLTHIVELGPTSAGSARLSERISRSFPDGVTRLSVLQSDEGGRFLEDVSRYGIVELPPERVEPPIADAAWLTLSEIEVLASRSGTFTNEARSAISLVLTFA